MKPSPQRTYTCSDYRQEMRLLGLKRRLEDPALTDDERRRLEAEIQALEREMGMDGYRVAFELGSPRGAVQGACLRPGAKPSIWIRRAGTGQNLCSQATWWNPSHFAAQTSVALRGELRGRARRSGRPLAQPVQGACSFDRNLV